MLRKLMLATTLALACQPKTDQGRMPRAAKVLSRGRANPVIIVGNQSAFGRFLQAPGRR